MGALNAPKNKSKNKSNSVTSYRYQSRTQRTGNAFERSVPFTGFTQPEVVLRKPPYRDVAEYGEADQA